ncbi:hypothetical protein QBC47DRAFT_444642 [Echria macrotheca]|uniref:Uncharacterized protein n=1 Tax=Echria macrotheca TaxID=438768 RepID=A0AAJ0F604_9PEZI|nr:hypothetical protein QBC47DRAFT_444642 [Echria macrotheca]
MLFQSLMTLLFLGVAGATNPEKPTSTSTGNGTAPRPVTTSEPEWGISIHTRDYPNGPTWGAPWASGTLSHEPTSTTPQSCQIITTARPISTRMSSGTQPGLTTTTSAGPEDTSVREGGALIGDEDAGHRVTRIISIDTFEALGRPMPGC